MTPAPSSTPLPRNEPLSTSDERRILTRAIERLLTDQIGERTCCTWTRDLHPGKTRSRKILYAQYSCSGAYKGDVFVKFARKLRFNSDLELFLSSDNTNNTAFTTPRFFGSGNIKTGKFGVWEYQSDPSLTDFIALSSDDVSRLIHAVAAINGMTARVLGNVPIKAGTYWVSPLSQKLVQFTDDLAIQREIQSGELDRTLHAFATIEEHLIRQLSTFQPLYFTHNDISPSNILLPPAPRLPIIVDWETASISIAGASLRNFSSLSERCQIAIADEYVNAMSAYNYNIDPREVYFTMGSMQIFYELSSALAYQSPFWLRKGVASIDNFLMRRL